MEENETFIALNVKSFRRPNLGLQNLQGCPLKTFVIEFENIQFRQPLDLSQNRFSKVLQIIFVVNRLERTSL